MKRVNLLVGGLLALMYGFSSCETQDVLPVSSTEKDAADVVCKAQYTEQQMKNWKETGSPFLKDELDNSSNTFIDPLIPSQGGVFKPLATPQTKAFGVNPEQNRFWTMIRLKIGTINPIVKTMVVKAISDIEKDTNIRFYNSIEEPTKDPIYGFVYPNVLIRNMPAGMATEGSTNVGRLGGEQLIYIPEDMNNNPSNYTNEEILGFIKHALCNVAGMYNEQQRYNRDEYVIVYPNNIQPANRYHFNKITTNYYARGDFDWHSITLAGSYDFSINGQLKTIANKAGGIISPNTSLSNLDRMFLNYFYLPYMPRTDTYRELDKVVYDGNNRQLTESERLELQAYLNNGNPNPPAGGRLIPIPW